MILLDEILEQPLQEVNTPDERSFSVHQEEKLDLSN